MDSQESDRSESTVVSNARVEVDAKTNDVAVTEEVVEEAVTEEVVEEAVTEEVVEEAVTEEVVEEAVTEEVVEEAVTEEVVEEAPAASPTAPITMMEFGAVEERIEFGYGQYMSKAGARELVSVALSIAERNEAGEVPILQIEGSASFVPVKNKRAYDSNEQLAKMRAEKARDAMITELAKRGLQVGVDYQIVLEWGVAGPEYKGDAVESATRYKNYQYAKFSLSRTMVEIRG